ncbi:MAG: hypothetical protein AAF230_07970 [Pseudomonadota bacterium]
MPEHFVVVIPSDPSIPVPETAEALRITLQRVAGGDASRVKDYGKLQFIDCGDGPCRIACPHCSAEISQVVWQGWMADDWHAENGFHLHRHVPPCCGTKTILDALTYAPMQGFARWMVSAHSPSAQPVSHDALVELENLAGLKLTPILQAY